MKIALPDFVSNSYFPVLAASALGCFRDEGLDLTIENLFPVDRAYEALRDGAVEFVATSAHAVLSAFPAWRGAKLLCAQSQGMYWFLVMRADLGARRGDLGAVKGRFIGAAPWGDAGLKGMLRAAGYDLARDDITIGPALTSVPAGVSFGIAIAEALAQGKIDGFWANGMAAELAVTRGTGTLVIDARRGDGPKQCFNFTQPCITATDGFITRHPDAAAAMVRAIVRAQKALRADVTLAAEVGRKLFPPAEAGLIQDIVARDLPYYDAAITPEFVTGMVQFARDQGQVSAPVPYGDIVAEQFAPLWSQKAAH